MRATQHAAYRSTLALLVMTEAPANGFELSHRAEEEIEAQTEDADQQHGCNDEIVSLARVARIDHKITETGIDGDHLGSNNNQPRDT